MSKSVIKKTKEKGRKHTKLLCISKTWNIRCARYMEILLSQRLFVCVSGTRLERENRSSIPFRPGPCVSSQTRNDHLFFYIVSYCRTNTFKPRRRGKFFLFQSIYDARSRCKRDSTESCDRTTDDIPRDGSRREEYRCRSANAKKDYNKKRGEPIYKDTTTRLLYFYSRNTLVRRFNLG